VIAVDKRAFVEATPIAAKKIRIFSREYNTQIEFSLDDVPDHLGVFKPFWTIISQVAKRARLDQGVELRIWSALPPGAGMGSSAAVSVAATAAIYLCFGLEPNKDEIFAVSFEAEKTVHGTPSGIDNAIATYGGALLFKRKKITQIKLTKRIPFVIGDTGVKRSTGEWIARVRMRRERQKPIVDAIIKTIGKISIKGSMLLKEGRLKDLGELMDINQGLLEALGVSTEALNRLILAARNAGAYGAKLTGAGGGGCMVALSSQDGIKRVAKGIRGAGGKPIPANVSLEGVKIEEKQR